eukprot:363662-Chlamydomonas_euryale.AAC.19
MDQRIHYEACGRSFGSGIGELWGGHSMRKLRAAKECRRPVSPVSTKTGRAGALSTPHWDMRA